MTDTPLSRRRRAAELFAAGCSQARVARELGVTRTTAMRWHRVWRRDGDAGLVRPGRRGRPRKLTPGELTDVLRELPRAWSVDRVAAELERRTGVHYHPGHVWRMLEEWGWSLPKEAPPDVAITDPEGNPISIRSVSATSSRSAVRTAGRSHHRA